MTTELQTCIRLAKSNLMSYRNPAYEDRHYYNNPETLARVTFQLDKAETLAKSNPEAEELAAALANIIGRIECYDLGKAPPSCVERCLLVAQNALEKYRADNSAVA